MVFHARLCRASFDCARNNLTRGRTVCGWSRRFVRLTTDYAAVRGIARPFRSMVQWERLANERLPLLFLVVAQEGLDLVLVVLADLHALRPVY